MHTYAVGEPFPHASSAEGVAIMMLGGFLTIVVFMAAPTEEEIDDVQTGTLRIGFCSRRDLMFVVPSFNDFVIGDATLDITMENPETAEHFLSASAENSSVGYVFLVDVVGGILRVIRQVAYDPKFTRSVRTMIRRQRKSHFLQYKLQTLREVTSHYSSNDIFALCETFPARHVMKLDRLHLV